MKWLLLDCSYLCHRAFHTTGNLSFKEVKTGVVFGFLRDIGALCGFHDTTNIAFCFDSTKSKRRDMYPDYKRARREKYEAMDEDEAKVWAEMKKQVKLLRTTYLPAIGFRNVFVQRGHEADDIIGSLCRSLTKEGSEAIMVASDHDLYQLLSPSVSMWNPNKKKFYRITDFIAEFELQPPQWALVKALAGCASDGVAGVQGIGEKTAAKYFAGKIPRHHQSIVKIKKDQAVFDRNLPLVQLPLKGTKTFDLVQDEVTKDSWREVCHELGMTSLEGMNLGPDARRRGVKPDNKRAKPKGFGIA